MIPILLLIALLVALGLLLVVWLATAPPHQVARTLKRVGLVALVALGLVLLVETQLVAGLVALVAALVPWVLRLVRLHALWRVFRPKPSSRRPDHAAREPPRHDGAGMSLAEAYGVLGLSPGATTTEIRAAHRRLMRLAHPDHGGSDWLAARINQARDRLLNRE